MEDELAEIIERLYTNINTLQMIEEDELYGTIQGTASEELPRMTGHAEPIEEVIRRLNANIQHLQEVRQAREMAAAGAVAAQALAKDPESPWDWLRRRVAQAGPVARAACAVGVFGTTLFVHGFVRGIVRGLVRGPKKKLTVAKHLPEPIMSLVLRHRPMPFPYNL